MTSSASLTISRPCEKRWAGRSDAATWRESTPPPIHQAPAEEPEGLALVGHSPAIIEVMKTLARVAPSQATVLMFGRDRHRQGAGGAHHPSLLGTGHPPVCPVNCSALGRGTTRERALRTCQGAFTGAAAARPGLFREADKGTLFLDEIGDISAGLQARLLRALQEHEIVPVGSETPVKVDVRVLAATHRDLPELVRQGRFREDLYYRLDVVTLSFRRSGSGGRTFHCWSTISSGP